MPSPRNNRQLRRLGAALIALVVIFTVMVLTSRERSEVTAVEKGIATLLYPFQVATDWVGDRLRSAGESVRELARLREENAVLREQIKAASQARARAEQLEYENQLLRTELKMKEQSPYPLLTAQVISRSSENWYRTVIINRGSRDGVQQNMAVVNWQGLVGKIAHTTPYTSTVQLLSDSGFGQQGFGAGAKVPTGELGLVETLEGGHIQLKFWSTTPSVSVGHPVYTSGQGVMPPDLLIGWVESLDASATFVKYAMVRPAVDFHKLDVVHVVLTMMEKEKDRGANAP
ncbi:MAG: rod shape-determining protein MreC [Bacillota bacterium]